MFYDIASFSGWLTIALVIGGATGWATWSDASRDGWFVGWAKWAAIAFIVGILVAILKILPGRAGLWLELALLMAMFYVAGCFIGGWLHGLFGARESAPAIAPAPVAAATVEIFGSAPESYPGARPAHAAASLGADDLTQISGIGTIDQKHLNDIGVHRYGQVAAWSGDNAIWVDHHLSNAGRIEREGWIASAATLAGFAGGSAVIGGAGAAAVSSGRVVAGVTALTPVIAAREPARIMSDPSTDSLRAAGGHARSEADRIRAEDGGLGAEIAARKSAEVEAKVAADRKAAAEAAKAEEAKRAAEASAASSGVATGSPGPAANAASSSAGAQQTGIAGAPSSGAGAAAASSRSSADSKAGAAGSSFSASSAATGGSGTGMAKAGAEAVATGTSVLGADQGKGSAPAGASPPPEGFSAAGKGAEGAAAAGVAPVASPSALASAGRGENTGGSGLTSDGGVDAKSDPATAAALSGAPGAGTVGPGASDTSSETKSAKPDGIAAPNGAADDLKLIKGIGPKNEKILNALGVYHFSQIADWSPENAAWTGHHMAFPGRIERESWIPQAKLLSAGIDTAHSSGVKSGAIKVDEKADEPMSEAEAATFAASMPATMAKVEGEEKYSGARPLGLADARGGVPDDLKLIKGIGKQNEARLHALGVWHFDQISVWSPENVKWIGSYLSFPGRIDREQWIAQSKDLAAGRETEFSKRAEAGLLKSSSDDGSHGQGVAKIDANS
jgi:predicted flap endonuclease-1-like 5' DNA nuclease